MTATYDSNLLKGTGLVQETLSLLDAYRPGLSKAEFARYVREYDLLGKATQARVDDVINASFARRYLSLGDDVVEALKRLRTNHVGLEAFTQLLYVYTARANPILADFVRQVYWPVKRSGSQEIRVEQTIDFIQEAQHKGLIVKPWSAITQREVARRLTACLADFKLIEPVSKVIRPFVPLDLTVLFLTHELHFRGLSDTDLLFHPDWEVLGLNREEVVQRLQRLAQRGHFIIQYSGELLAVSWKYNTLSEAADAISRS